MKDTNRIWFLMGKELSHSITLAEEEELRTLLVSEPELWYSYELLQAVYHMDDVTQEYVQEIKSLLDNRIEPERLNLILLTKLEETDRQVTPAPPSKYKTLYRFAAVFAGIVVLTLAGWMIFKPAVINKPGGVAMSEIIAPKGSKKHITLADGTTIWLNAGSKLSYPSNFNLANREVYLSGEAYFKVIHHDKYNFVVHTAEADIKDLGTTFNVKAYEGSSRTETTLIEGALEVSLKKDPAKKMLMSPREKLVLQNKQPVAEKEHEQPVQVFEVSTIVPYAKTNDIVETAWVENKLIFRDERFEHLATMMERRYNVSIVIEDKTIKEYQLTGIFKNENLTQALKLLQVIAPFKFKINNEQVLIYK